MAALLQLVCKAVDVKWKLHTMYRSQSSRTVERMNCTIRVTLAKWVSETGAPSRMDVLPSVLMRVRMAPGHGYSPYEIMFRRPPPLIWEVKGNLLQKGGMEVLRQLEQVGKLIHDITCYV